MKRFTNKELEAMNDFKFIAEILRERRSKLTNPYAPLTAKLNKVIYKVVEAEALGKTFEDLYK